MEGAESCLEEDIVLYLDQSGQLQALSSALQTFSANTSVVSESSLNDSVSSFNSIVPGSSRPFRLNLHFDLISICDRSPELARFIENNPEGFRSQLQDVVYQFSQYLGSDEVSCKSQERG